MKKIEDLIKKLKASLDSGKSLTIKADTDGYLLLEDLKKVKLLADELIKLDNDENSEIELKTKRKLEE